MRLILVLALLLPIGVMAQDAPKKGPRPAPKNLKVLKDLPPDQLIPTMRAFSAALGVQCNHCHIQGDFASDENPKKDVARKMITMVQQIGTNFPSDKHYVTCYTCHRGATEPLVAPPAAATAPAK